MVSVFTNVVRRKWLLGKSPGKSPGELQIVSLWVYIAGHCASALTALALPLPREVWGMLSQGKKNGVYELIFTIYNSLII